MIVTWVISRVTATSDQGDKPRKPSYHIGYWALDKEKNSRCIITEPTDKTSRPFR